MISQSFRPVLFHGIGVTTLLLAILLLTGCGGASSTSAAEAGFHNYLAAVKTKRMSNIETYVSGWQHNKLLGTGAIRKIKMYVASLPQQITVTEVKIKNESQAIVYVQGKHLDSGVIIKGQFHMIFEGNIWKVNKEQWDQSD